MQQKTFLIKGNYLNVQHELEELIKQGWYITSFVKLEDRSYNGEVVLALAERRFNTNPNTHITRVPPIGEWPI